MVAENSKQDRVVLRRKVKVPSAPNSCAVYHINGDISVKGRNATIQFVGTGPVEKFVCKCDSASREECKTMCGSVSCTVNTIVTCMGCYFLARRHTDIQDRLTKI